MTGAHCASGPTVRARHRARTVGPDAHVVLGNITATSLSGGVALDSAAARATIHSLAAALGADDERVARAMVDIADASVARALRRVSVERGVDPRDCVLVPFGGGGPLHACGLAEQLGMRTIFVPPHAGVLSAVGLAITSERRERLVSVLATSTELDEAALARAMDRAADGVTAGPGWSRDFTARVRYVGQGFELDVPVQPGDDGTSVAGRFNALHGSRNGFTLDAACEVVAMRHVASGPPCQATFVRDDVGNDAPVSGPAVVALEGATLRIGAGWRGEAHATGGWMLVREA